MQTRLVSHWVTVSPGSAITRFTRSSMPGAVPLDVRLGREHDDVAAVHVVQVVAQLVDEHAVADLRASAPSTPTGCRRPGTGRS